MLKKLIISRTDSIGDVILTLPAAGLMKKHHPGIIIYFIGRSYTQPIIEACENIDEFVNWDIVLALSAKEQVDFFRSLEADAIVHVFPDSRIAKLAFKSHIPSRVGTSHRLYHWLYCNRIMALGRKNSPWHETQLNLQLFRPFGAEKNYPLDTISVLYGLNNVLPLNGELLELIDKTKFNLILHPKSKGSAREWGVNNFEKLIDILPKGKFKIFITGTIDDRKLLTSLLCRYKDEVVDLTGKMSLAELISFIREADGLVAASTGPLHIASALGKVAIGLYAPMRPIHPGRWAPIGRRANYLVIEKKCDKCRHGNHCECMLAIKPIDVVRKISEANHDKEGEDV
jgi:heptosyltransferase III